MTRDEAIAKWKTHGLTSVRKDLSCVRPDLAEKYLERMATADVDGFAALGMLKLDDPKPARDKFREEMLRIGYHEDSAGLSDAMDAFDASQK